VSVKECGRHGNFFTASFIIFRTEKHSTFLLMNFRNERSTSKQTHSRNFGTSETHFGYAASRATKFEFVPWREMAPLQWPHQEPVSLTKMATTLTRKISTAFQETACCSY
jgi:hypothetical protein